MNPLKSDEYPAIYTAYIETISGDIMDLLNEQVKTFPMFLAGIPEEKSEYAYAEGKWTIKEVVGHIIDTERIMAYRALRFARNDTKELIGFEPDDFVANARFNERSLKSLSDEFALVRESNVMLFRHLNDHELMRKGLASERLISVRAFMYIIAGHLNHHRNIIRERYLGE
ncbi:DinB family protein [Parapedobacter sp. ISTM3]|uniref:DinB superfamily protein n=1 Tax=Parapedobacter luteus TaxID=623280 RepID=A0A1T4ZX37_9SPHI|nr:MULTISPECIES: DinB family protein [Parapedobacter]MBK1438761.1 DinB family protein [Parapedobacter sp. ISTM3]SKB27361.1 DinB superfamily protein [Parapedobacter luteus]